MCSKCSKEVNKKEIYIIDNKPICFVCMYGDSKPFEIYPIGKVRTSLNPYEKHMFPGDSKKTSCIDLFDSQKGFMYKLDEEKHLTIVYYLHKVKSVKTVFHRMVDGKMVGVFASRTPHRLSGIAIQDVKLVKIERTTLYVENLDAIDGSPVLDVKLRLNTLEHPHKIRSDDRNIKSEDENHNPLR